MQKLAQLCDEIGRLHGFTPRVIVHADAFGLHSIKLEYQKWNYIWKTFHEMFPDEDMTFKAAVDRFVKECRDGLEESHED